MTTEADVQAFTGDQYLDSLNDDRKVYLHGQQIDDVSSHPAFRNTARSIAMLYDALHDPHQSDTLLMNSDTDEDFKTHSFFRSSYNADDLLQARDAIVGWQKPTYGWMGRTPDYKAAFMATLGGNAEFYDPFQDNARRWYKRFQKKCLFMNHAIINPPVDRDKPPHQVKDVFLRIVDENDEGVVVSGAKMVGTSSALCHANFVSYHPMGVPLDQVEGADSFAVSFIAEMNNPGIKMICRPSYEMNASITGSPFDYPLSSRFDENDAVLIMDEALIPWENVLIHRDIEKANTFISKSGFRQRVSFQGCTRLAVKLDFVSGLLLNLLEATGTKDFRGIRVKVGQILAWRNMLWSLSDEAARNPEDGPGDTVLPRYEATGGSARALGPRIWTEVRTLIEDLVGGALIVQPGSKRDFQNDEIRELLNQYYRGSGGIDAQEKIKMVKLMWDAIGTEFGARHELYERYWSGNHDVVRFDILNFFEDNETTEELKEYADQCMDEYDLDGWGDDTPWVNPDDVNVLNNVEQWS